MRIIQNIYLFIFGWAGPSLLHVGFLQLQGAEAPLPRGVRVSHCGGRSRHGTRAPGHSSVVVVAGLSSSAWWAPGTGEAGSRRVVCGWFRRKEESASVFMDGRAQGILILRRNSDLVLVSSLSHFPDQTFYRTAYLLKFVKWNAMEFHEFFFPLWFKPQYKMNSK